MAEALFWGLLSASSLVLGAVLAIAFSLSRRTIGLVMAFAAGVLISAVAYELVLEAVENYGATGVAVGLAAGSLTFFAGDTLLDRAGASERKSSAGGGAGSSAMAIVLGTVLDGIPESAVLGLTLVEGGIGVTMLVAVFMSNLPEAMAATAGMRRDGWPVMRLLSLWLGVMAVSGIASAAGYGLFSDAPSATVGFILAFAAGAILTMLADTMMPEALEDSGPAAGLVTTLGFALAFAIQSLE
jgi:ZIP family zinc transporter